MTENEPSCECSGPGFCPRYQIQQGDYAYGVCSGKGSEGRPCPQGKSEAYRRRWRRDLTRKAQAVGGPTLVKKIANAGRAVVAAARDRFRRTPEDVLAVRQDLCLACDLNDGRDRGVLGACLHPSCGCTLVKKLSVGLPRPSKLEVASQKCPLGKWGAVRPPPPETTA